MRARGGGSIRPRAPGTVGAWMTRWLEEQRESLSANGYAHYEWAWRRHAAPILGAQTLERLDVEDVEALYRALRNGGASPTVIGRVAMVMHRAIAVAIRRRTYTKANPFALVDRPKVARSQTRVLEPEDARRFLEEAKADRYAALWTLLLTAGLRIGEALGLEWGDLDLDQGRLSVRRSLIEVNGYVELGPTKTAGSRRLVTLGPVAVRALRERRRQADAETHGSKLVFPTLAGTPLRRSNLRRSHFVPICERAGIEGLRIHDLRHSMTSLALLGGVSAKVVSERLGHSTTRLTLDRYSHLLGDLQSEAANTIETTLAGRPSRKRSAK